MAASATIVSVPAIRGDEKQSPDPWTSAQIVQAAALAHELDDKNGAAPTVVYVGFTRYSSAAIFQELRSKARHPPRRFSEFEKVGGRSSTNDESGCLLRVLPVRKVSQRSSSVHGLE